MMEGMVLLNRDRGGASGTSPKHGVVVHDSEGAENSAQLLAFLGAGGDRDNGHGGRYGGGYNAVATEDGSYTVVATGERSPYHAPPTNSNMWSICIPGRAAQTREQWADPVSAGYVVGVAHYIVDRWHDDGQVWPMQYAVAADLRAAGTSTELLMPVGWTTHAQVSLAFHQTDHTDPGPSFPFDTLTAHITRLLAGDVGGGIGEPPKEDDVSIKILRSMSNPPEFYAQFIAVCDAQGHSIEVQWSGDGADPKVVQRMADLRAAGITDQDIAFTGLRNNVLHPKNKPADIDDELHTWTADDFAT